MIDGCERWWTLLRYWTKLIYGEPRQNRDWVSNGSLFHPVRTLMAVFEFPSFLYLDPICRLGKNKQQAFEKALSVRRHCFGICGLGLGVFPSELSVLCETYCLSPSLAAKWTLDSFTGKNRTQTRGESILSPSPLNALQPRGEKRDHHTGMTWIGDKATYVIDHSLFRLFFPIEVLLLSSFLQLNSFELNNKYKLLLCFSTQNQNLSALSWIQIPSLLECSMRFIFFVFFAFPSCLHLHVGLSCHSIWWGSLRGLLGTSRFYSPSEFMRKKGKKFLYTSLIFLFNTINNNIYID